MSRAWNPFRVQIQFASICIPGLCSLRGKFPLTVVLSPRNAQKAEKLRDEFPEIIRVANSTGDAKRFFSSFSCRWMMHRKWSCYFKEGIEMLRSWSEGVLTSVIWQDKSLCSKTACLNQATKRWSIHLTASWWQFYLPKLRCCPSWDFVLASSWCHWWLGYTHDSYGSFALLTCPFPWSSRSMANWKR